MTFGGLTAAGIWLEHHSRRQEIGYFVMAKAAQGVYRFAKRAGHVSVRNEFEVMHVVIMTLIYYIYCQHPDKLKFRNIFQMVLGD
jgi:hypothetical protein